MAKNLPAKAGDTGLISFPEGGSGNPLLKNPVDRGAWWAIQSMGSQRVGHTEYTSTVFMPKSFTHLLSNLTTPVCNLEFSSRVPVVSRIKALPKCLHPNPWEL